MASTGAEGSKPHGLQNTGMGSHSDYDHAHDEHDHTGHDLRGQKALDHHHGAGHVHGSGDKKRVLIAACLTAGFMVAEALGGWLTGSLALLADAGHMLTDAVALSFAWYAFHLGAKAATQRMTFGYDRFKTLVAYTNGLAIFAIAIFILYEAWQRLEAPAPVLAGPMLVIALMGLGVNIIGFLILHGGDRDNLNMRGALLHVMGDLLGSVAAIIAAIVIMLTGWWPIDPILSVLVCLILFRSAWGLVRLSANVLLEAVPAELDRDDIARDLEASIAGLREIHHMHVWSLDGQKNLATLHACLADEAEPLEIVRAVKQRLAQKHGITHATVETERDHCADHSHDHIEG